MRAGSRAAPAFGNKRPKQHKCVCVVQIVVGDGVCQSVCLTVCFYFVLFMCSCVFLSKRVAVSDVVVPFLGV